MKKIIVAVLVLVALTVLSWASQSNRKATHRHLRAQEATELRHRRDALREQYDAIEALPQDQRAEAERQLQPQLQALLFDLAAHENSR